MKANGLVRIEWGDLEEPMPEVVAVDEPPLDTPPPPPPNVVDVVVAAGKSMKKVKQVDSSLGDAKRMSGKSINLVKLFNDLDDHFLKASESTHEVSKMLEATRFHYHSSFADNRGLKNIQIQRLNPKAWKLQIMDMFCYIVIY
ncbi:hypothetical protein CsatA_006103 [Cannabis sativa]